MLVHRFSRSMSVISFVLLLWSGYSTAAGKPKLPPSFLLTLNQMTMKPRVNAIEEIETTRPIPATISFGPAEEREDRADTTMVAIEWVDEVSRKTFRLDLGEMYAAPFLAYLDRAPGVAPWLLLDSGDGTWQVAQNMGLWVTLDRSGLRLYQALGVKDVEEQVLFEPARTIARYHQVEIPIDKVEQQIKLIPNNLGVFPEHPDDQNFFVGTEGRTALPVVVLGYQTVELRNETTDRHTLLLQGFEDGSQIAWVTPRVHLRDPKGQIFPIYRVPAHLLHHADAKRSAELKATSKQFSAARTERWLHFFLYGFNSISGIQEGLSPRDLLQERVKALKVHAQNRSVLIDHLVRASGTPFSCIRAVTTDPNSGSSDPPKAKPG